MRLLMILLGILYAYMSLWVVIWLLMQLWPPTISAISQGEPTASIPPLVATTARALPLACTLALILGVVFARLQRPLLSELVMLVPVGLILSLVAYAPSYAGNVATGYLYPILSMLGVDKLS